MVQLGVAPHASFLAKATPKPLTDEEKAKKAAEEERKKNAESLMAYQEKLDQLSKLELEISESRSKAFLASPHLLGAATAAGMLPFSPQLGLGNGGLMALARGGPEGLVDPHRRLRDWLDMQNPRVQQLSAENQAVLAKYQNMEEYLRNILERYETLRQENDHLVKTIQYRTHDDFDRDPYDYADGADPYYEAEQLRRRQRRVSAPHYPPPHAPAAYHHHHATPAPRSYYDDQHYAHYSHPHPPQQRQAYYTPAPHSHPRPHHQSLHARDAPSPRFAAALEAERGYPAHHYPQHAQQPYYDDPHYGRTPHHAPRAYHDDPYRRY